MGSTKLLLGQWRKIDAIVRESVGVTAERPVKNSLDWKLDSHAWVRGPCLP